MLAFPPIAAECVCVWSRGVVVVVGLRMILFYLMVQEFCHLPHKFQSSLKHKGDVRQVNISKS